MNILKSDFCEDVNLVKRLFLRFCKEMDIYNFFYIETKERLKIKSMSLSKQIEFSIKRKRLPNLILDCVSIPSEYKYNLNVNKKELLNLLWIGFCFSKGLTCKGLLRTEIDWSIHNTMIPRIILSRIEQKFNLKCQKKNLRQYIEY